MTSERVVINLKPSPLIGFLPMDILGFYSNGVLFARFPWRGIVASLLTLLVGSIMGQLLEKFNWPIYALALVVAIFPPLLEMIFRREYITNTKYIKRYGIIGRGHLEIPLESFVSVEVDYPRYGAFWNIGTIKIFTDQGRIVAQGVGKPEVVVKHIEQLMQSANKRRMMANQAVQRTRTASAVHD
jgi:hypothetical protein